MGLSPAGCGGPRGRSSSGGWLLRVMMTGSSITLMLLHCMRSCSRLKMSSALEHLNAKIPGNGEKAVRASKTQYLCFHKDRCPHRSLPPSCSSLSPYPQTLHPGCSQLYPISLPSLKTDRSDLLPDHSQNIQTRGLPESKGLLFPHRFLTELGEGWSKGVRCSFMQ